MNYTEKHFNLVRGYMSARIGYLREEWGNLCKKEYPTAETRTQIRILRGRIREAEAIYQILIDGNTRYKVPYFISKEVESLKDLRKDKK